MVKSYSFEKSWICNQGATWKVEVDPHGDNFTINFVGWKKIPPSLTFSYNITSTNTLL